MPLQVLAEKMRQTLGVDGRNFQPISLERYKQALGDAARFADWLTEYQKTAQNLEQSMQGFFTATSTAVHDCPLPSLYSERYDTHELRPLPPAPLPQQYAHLAHPLVPSNPNSVASLNPNTPSGGLNPDPDPSPKPSTPGAAAAAGLGFNESGQGVQGLGSRQVDAADLDPNPNTPKSSAGPAAAGAGFSGVGEGGGLEGLDTLCNRFADKVQWQLMVPMDLWLHAYREAKARLTALDTLRLKVDAQRRKVERRSRHFLEIHHQHLASRHSSSSSNTVPKSPAAAAAAAAAAASSSDAFVAGSLETTKGRRSVDSSSGSKDRSAAAAAAVEIAQDVDRQTEQQRRGSGRERRGSAAAAAAGGDVSDGEESPGSGAAITALVDSDDEETWAEAVYRRRGEKGLLAAHEMVERKLQPLLSEFSSAEMKLSLLLGWLVTQAARLRAYFTHILVNSAGQVDGWQLPQGLLEPFPADIVPLDNAAAAALWTAPAAAAAAPSGPEAYTGAHPTGTPAAAAAAVPAAAAEVMAPAKRPALGPDFRLNSGKETPTAAAAADIAPAAAAAATSTAAAAAAAREAVQAGGSSGSSKEVWRMGLEPEFERDIHREVKREDDILPIESQTVNHNMGDSVGRYIAESAESDYVTPDTSFETEPASSGSSDPAAAVPAIAAEVAAAGRDGGAGFTPAAAASDVVLPPPAAAEVAAAAPAADLPRSLAAPAAAAAVGGVRQAPQCDRPDLRSVAAAAASDLPKSVAPSAAAGAAAAAAILSLDREAPPAATAADERPILTAHAAPPSRDIDLQPVRSADVAAAAPAADLPRSLADVAAPRPAAAAAPQQQPMAARAAAARPLESGASAAAPAVAAIAAEVAAAGKQGRDYALTPAAAAGSEAVLPSPAAAAPAADLPRSLAAAPAAAAVPTGTVAIVPGVGAVPLDEAGGSSSRGGARSVPTAPTPHSTPDLTGSSNTEPAAAAARPPVLPYIEKDKALLNAIAAGDNGCDVCSSGSSDARTAAQQQQHQDLLARVAELERERAQHAAAAAEAERMRAAATDRAREIERRLNLEVPTEKQQLLQQQEAAAAELSALGGRRAAAAARVKQLEGELASLVEQQQGLMMEQLQVKQDRVDLDSRREYLTNRVKDLRDMAASLSARHQRAEAITAERQSSLETLERQIGDIEAELAGAEGRRQGASARLQQAQQELEQVNAHLVRLDSEETTHRQRLHDVETTELPQVTETLAAVTAEHQQLRQQQLGPLETQVMALKAQEQQKAREADYLMQRVNSAAGHVSEVESEAAALMCESTSLRATATRAEGTEIGEEARAAAAAAEAQGLKVAADQLVQYRRDLSHLTAAAALSPRTAAAAAAGQPAITAEGGMPRPGSAVLAIQAELAHDADKARADVAGDDTSAAAQGPAAAAAAELAPATAGADVARGADLALEVPSPDADLALQVPSHDAELAHAAELAHEAAVTGDADLARAAERAKAAEASKIAAEQGISMEAARRVVGLESQGPGSSGLAAAAAPAGDTAAAAAGSGQLPAAAEKEAFPATTAAAEGAVGVLTAAAEQQEQQGLLSPDSDMYDKVRAAELESERAIKAQLKPLQQQQEIGNSTAAAAAAAPAAASIGSTAGTETAAAGPAAAASTPAAAASPPPAAAAGSGPPSEPTSTPKSKGRTLSSILHLKPMRDSVKQLLKRQQLRKKWRLGVTPLGGAPDEPPEVEVIDLDKERGLGGVGYPVQSQGLGGYADQGQGLAPGGYSGAQEVSGEVSSPAAAAAAAPAAAVPMGPLAAEGSLQQQQPLPLESASIGSSKTSGSRAAGFAKPSGSGHVSSLREDTAPMPGDQAAAAAAAQPQQQQQYSASPSMAYTKQASDKYGQYAPQYEQQYLPGHSPPAAAAVGSSGSGDMEGYRARGPLEAAGDAPYDGIGRKHGSKRHGSSSSGRYY